MIAKSWNQTSVTSQVIGTPVSPRNAIKVSRSDPARYAKKRDREVPYGMKGGEH